ncbi:MAG: glycine cleavage T C-terminal barrel domain-containing protein [Acidimicrobiales bacterium]
MTAPRDLRTAAGAVAIERDVVRAQGPEAVAFLQGQLSQDVAAMALGSSAPTFLLQPTGKVDAWLRVTRLGDDDVLLDVAAGWGEAVLSRLRRFKLRTKVDLDRATWCGFAVRGPGSAGTPAPADGVRLDASWPGVESVDVLSQGGVTLEGIATAAPEALEALRIECGVPAMGAELTDATIPAEVGQWVIAASVSFTKGCYTGQELVARIDSRGGNVPRPVRGLRIDGQAVPVGADVLASPEDQAVVGHVTSSATSAVLGPIALAPVGRSIVVGQPVVVRWDGGQASAVVAELPFL